MEMRLLRSRANVGGRLQSSNAWSMLETGHEKGKDIKIYC